MPSPSRTAEASIPATTSTGIPIKVRRSARRKRTVNAVFRDGVALISIPAHFSTAQEAEWVKRMVARLEQRVAEPDAKSSAGELMGRAAELSDTYLSGRARPVSVRWVGNQNSRWGSATPGRGTIRLSDKLQGMPDWVIDYVLLHELAHLLVPSHGPAFWRLLESYPQTETAKAFLSGAAFASARGLKGEMGEDNGTADDGDTDDGDMDDGDMGDGDMGDGAMGERRRTRQG